MKHLKSYKQFEDATAGATTAGMGAVTASQPSSVPGALNGAAFTGGGGTIGSGDLGSNWGGVYSKSPATTTNNKKRKKKASKRNRSPSK
jgi:phosphoribosylamine-glycine ligase